MVFPCPWIFSEAIQYSSVTRQSLSYRERARQPAPKAMTLAARNTAVPKSDYSSSNTRIPRSTTPANACA